MKQCHEHIDFTVKVSTMSFGAFFGTGGASSTGTEKRSDGEYIDGYKVADADDMMELAKILGG